MKVGLGIIGCFTMALGAADMAIAEEKFLTHEIDVSQLLNALSVGGSLHIDQILSDSRVRQICLVSTEDGVELNAAGCRSSTPSLVFLDDYGQCIVIDLSVVTSRVLSGSLETECRNMEPDLSLEKVDRFGQHHIIFSEKIE